MLRSDTSIRFAWRDLAASPRRAFATVLILSAACAALYASRAIASETGLFIEGDPRSWLGGDVIAVITGTPKVEQLQAIAHHRYTVSAECLSFASSTNAADPSVVTLRAVDPTLYPFYGFIELEPSQPLAQALGPESAVVTRGLLDRLHVAVGDSMRIGSAQFRIAGVLLIEPDRLSSVQSAYPRVMLSRSGFERSGIPLRQSHIAYRFLFRNTAGMPLEELHDEISKVFPDGTVSDYRHADPRVASTFDAIIAAFQLSAWSALVLGSVGASLLLYLHIERRLDTVAILKSLGASNAWLTRGYVLQSFGLSLAGSAVGLVLGHIATRAIAGIERHLALPVNGHLSPISALEAAGTVIACAAVVTAIPLHRIRGVKPLRLLRRSVEEGDARSGRSTLIAGIVLSAMALWLAGSVSLGLAFLCAVGSLGLLMRVTAPLLLGLPQRWLRKPLARYAAVNLTRRGNHMDLVVAAMAAGVFAILVPAAIRPTAALELLGALPDQSADLVVPGLRREQAERLASLAGGQVTLRPHAQVRPQGQERRVTAACVDDLAENEAALSQQYATQWRVSAGSTLMLAGNGRRFNVTLKAVKQMDSVTHFRSGLTLSCRTFDWLNPNYEAEIRVDGGREADVIRIVQETLPGAPVLRPKEYEQRMKHIAGRGINALQVMSSLSLVCGLILLVAIAVATYRTRMHEAAVLKVLGARRANFAFVIAIEYGTAGAIAGLIGGLLPMAGAAGIESVLLRKGAVIWAWDLPLLAALPTALAAAIVGLLAVWRMLPRRPMDLLRMDG